MHVHTYILALIHLNRVCEEAGASHSPQVRSQSCDPNLNHLSVARRIAPTQNQTTSVISRVVRSKLTKSVPPSTPKSPCHLASESSAASVVRSLGAESHRASRAIALCLAISTGEMRRPQLRRSGVRRARSQPPALRY